MTSLHTLCHHMSTAAFSLRSSDNEVRYWCLGGGGNSRQVKGQVHCQARCFWGAGRSKRALISPIPPPLFGRSAWLHGGVSPVTAVKRSRATQGDKRQRRYICLLMSLTVLACCAKRSSSSSFALRVAGEGITAPVWCSSTKPTSFVVAFYFWHLAVLLYVAAADVHGRRCQII